MISKCLLSPASGLVKKRVLFLALLGACGFFVIITSLLTFADVKPGNIDDAFITLVYSRHLADSGQFYWNIGDGNLDGFTSFLDMIIKAVMIRLTAMEPLELAWWLTLFWHATISLSAFTLGIFLNRGGRLRVLICSLFAGCAVATSPIMADGSSYLLETPLYVLFCFWAVVIPVLNRVLTWNQTVLWTLLLVMTSLIRPEGLLLVCGLASYLLVENWRSENRLKSIVPFAVLSTASLVYFSWHFWTFGTLFPNAYYAKTSVSRWHELQDGVRYLSNFFRNQPITGAMQLAWVVLGPLWVLSKAWQDSNARRGYLILSGSAFITLALVIISGGDCYTGKRFLALPAVLVLASLIHAGSKMTGRIKFIPLGFLALLTTIQLAEIGLAMPAKYAAIRATWPLGEKQFIRDQEVIARLSAVLQNGVIAQSDFQLYKYFSDQTRVVDLHGLNDRRFAHVPFEGQVLWGKFRYRNVIQENAPVWVYGPYFYSETPWASFSTHSVLFDPDVYLKFVGWGFIELGENREVATAIEATYLPASLPIKGVYFNFLVRRDWASQLAAAGIIVHSINSNSLLPVARKR